MAVSKLSPVYDELLDFLVKKATPKEILAFAPSEAAQARADYLTERNKADALAPEERAELEQLIEFDTLVGLLKAKAMIHHLY